MLNEGAMAVLSDLGVLFESNGRSLEVGREDCPSGIGFFLYELKWPDVLYVVDDPEDPEEELLWDIDF